MLKNYLQQIKERSTGIICTFDMILSTILFGSSPNNYADFDFKNLSLKQRGTYVTNRYSRKMIKKFNNISFEKYFEDKTLFAKEFSQFFNRDWISNKNLTYEQFKRFVKDKDKFIYKPISNAQGQGIRVFDDLSDLKYIYKIIINSDEAILEEWIKQHEVLDKVYPEAINCLRIITVCGNNKICFLAGGITWGNGKKIANASASGIVSPVNFKTGVLEKPAADFYGHCYYKHPVTNVDLVGIKIPFWTETLKMLKKASFKISQIGYVGWDIAITPDGPVIIEGNTTPGYRYYQIPIHMTNHCGNKAIYKRCYKNIRGCK